MSSFKQRINNILKTCLNCLKFYMIIKLKNIKGYESNINIIWAT